MWLVAAGVVFVASQAITACCEPSGPMFGSLIKSAVAASPQPQDAIAQDDCCDTPMLPCPMGLDGMPPLSLPSACLSAQNHSPDFAAPIAQIALRLPASSDADRRARVPIAQAPPDPIFLRFQRFLI